MKRTVGSMRSWLWCAGLATVVAACDGMPDPEFAALERTLSLRVVEVRRAESGEATDFRLELKNGGSRPAAACLGPDRNVSYRAGFSGGTRMQSVDHPGCVRDFSIPPGGVMVWSESHEVPRKSEGLVEVDVEVEIVNPRRCSSGGGCAAFNLRSNALQLP